MSVKNILVHNNEVGILVSKIYEVSKEKYILYRFL